MLLYAEKTFLMLNLGDWIKLIIPSAIAIGSLIVAIIALKKSKVKLKVDFTNYWYLNSIFLSGIIINTSNSPVTIYSIELKANKKKYVGKNRNSKLGGNFLDADTFSELRLLQQDSLETEIKFDVENRVDILALKTKIILYTPQKKFSFKIKLLPPKSNNSNY